MKYLPMKTIFLLIAVSLVVVTAGCKKEYIHVGENWEFIHKLKAPEDTFTVTANGLDSANIGEEMKYNVTSKQDGHLWVVQVDPDDEISLLFPNEMAKDNSIKAGKAMTIPPQGAAWAIEASEPKGESVVVFVVTTGEVDIDDVLVDENSMAKAIRIVEKTPSWGFDKKIISIK